MTSRRLELCLGGALAVGFIVARVVPFAGAHIGRGLDTYDYRTAATFPPLSRAFLAGPRPFGYPLYLKLVRHNEHVAVVGQLVLDTAAWLALALMAARATRNAGLRVAAGSVVLALGATLEAIQWDRLVTSEALSTAFALGVLAGMLWLRERWTAPRVALVAALALAATVLRDSNATFFGFVGVVFVIGVAVRRLRPRALVLAVALLAVATVGSVSASMGNRWESQLRDVITLRILNSPERLAYFEHAGMPLTARQIRSARGHCVSPVAIPSCVTVVNPKFYEWIHQHGRATYAAALAKFPATTLWEPIANLRSTIGTRVEVEIATGSGERAPVSKLLEAVFFVRNPMLLASWAVIILVLAVTALVRRRRGVFVVGAALVALAYPHLWIAWIGDGLEVARHSLLASIQLRIGLWLGAIWLLDAVVDRRYAGRSGAVDQRPV